MQRGDTQHSPGAPASSDADARAPADPARAEAESSSDGSVVDRHLDRALADALRAPTSTPPGALIDDKYVLLTLIGEGGMSRVFEAKNHLTGGHVALKWLHGRPGSPGIDPHRLIQEARATARIEHPNVVQVFDLGFMAGQPYLVMELLRGGALDQHLERSGPMTARHAVLLLAPVLDAAQAFHRAGVVHRDLKPANLFLVQDGVNPPYLKVLDFGVASLIPNVGEGEESLSLTQPGMALGTPFYMAPEQLRREKADARSDVFALGCILYEMCTGERPFPARDIVGLLEMLQSEQPEDRRERLRGAVPALGDVLAQALAFNPKHRFQTAEEFQNALLSVSFTMADAGVPETHLEVREDLSDRGPSNPCADAVPSTRRRRPRRLLGFIALTAALLVGSMLILKSKSSGVRRDPGNETPAPARAEAGVLARDPAKRVEGVAEASPTERPIHVEISSLHTEAPRVTAKKPIENAALQPRSTRPLSTSAGELKESDF
jgi:serine/threonine protein kinase